MNIKRICFALAALCFATGLFLLFNGQSILSMFLALLVLILLQSGAIAKLRIDVAQIMDYLIQESHGKEKGKGNR